MRTQARAGADADVPTSSADRHGAGRIREQLPSLILIAVAGGLVAAFFLALYAVKQYPMPIGWDTPRYLDQTNLVAAHGLAGVPQHLPPPIKTLPSRGGFPIVILTMSSLFHAGTFTLAAVAPPAAAVAVALAAGALVSSVRRRPAWEAAAVAVMVGTSSVVIRLMAPETYTDNLFASAIFVAALVALISSAQGGEGFWAAVVLLGAGGIAHGPSFAVVAVALAVAAVALVPQSLRRWRSGERLLSTPAARLAGAAVGGGAVAAAGIFGVLRAAPDTPKLSRGELLKKVRDDVPLYRYWLIGPVAAVGAWALGTGRPAAAQPPDDGVRRRASRVLLTLLLAWTAVCVGGAVLFFLGRNAPAHRFLSFLLPLPILVAVGVLALGTLVGGRLGRRAGAAVVLAGVLGVAAVGTFELYVELAGPRRGVEWIDPAKIHDAAGAAAYLTAAGVPVEAPVVYVIDDTGPNPLSYVPEMTYMLRSVLPAERVPHTYVYVGNPLKYLAGRPTYRSHPSTYDVNANRFWPTVQALLPQHPVSILLASYNPLYTVVAHEHPAWVVGTDVLVLSGPRPSDQVPSPAIPTGPRTFAAGIGSGAGTIVAFTAIGLGWVLALFPRGLRPFERLALAPAVGIAVLILGGIAADGVGLRLVGAGGAGIPIAVALLGAGAARLRLRRADPNPSSPAPA